MKTIRDAVHGDIQFDAAEIGVMDTPSLQRLRGIKQLGMAHLVFPSAVHSRFEHSLGSCWLAKRILEALRRDGGMVDDRLHRGIRLAALLHDVTHIPFGHTIEDERRLFVRHDEDPARLETMLNEPAMASALDRAGCGDLVRAILSSDGSVPAFARQIVTGTVCADLLDYLKRDAFFTGLALSYDDRIFQYFGVSGDQLAFRLHKGGQFRRDALSELVSLLQMRYALTERVYYHHAKVVAGAMVSRILELALSEGGIRFEELLWLRDDGLFALLRERAGANVRLLELMDDLASRRLFTRVYSLGLEGFGRGGASVKDQEALAARFHDDPDERRRVECRIASEIGAPTEYVVIYCPSPKMALKEADVPVEIDPGAVVPLSALGHPDVDALREKHRGLWRLIVCVRRSGAIDAGAAGRACEQAIGFANQLEPLRRGRLAFA